MKDAALKVTKAFPAAGASNSSDPLDLKARGTPQGETPAHAEVWLTIPTVAALADTKTLTIQLEESDDNSTYSSTGTGLPSFVLTGAGGAGATGYTAKIRLKPSAPRYLRATSTVASAGGTITGSSLTLELFIP